MPSFNGQTPSCSEERVISCSKILQVSAPTPKPASQSRMGGQYRPSIEQARHSNDCRLTATGAGRLLKNALATISDRITTSGCDGVEPREAAAACQWSPKPKRGPKAPGVRSCHCHRSCGVSLLDAYAGLGKRYRCGPSDWPSPHGEGLSGHSPSPTTPESSHISRVFQVVMNAILAPLESTHTSIRKMARCAEDPSLAVGCPRPRGRWCSMSWRQGPP